MAKLDLKGLKEVQRQLESVAQETRAKLLRSAMRAAFKPVLEDAKARAPRDTGALAEGLTLASARGSSDDSIAVGIVVVNNSARQKQATMAAAAFGEGQSKTLPPSRRWHFEELGTANSPARPFLRPALIRGAAGVVGALQAEVAKRVRKALKK